VAEKLIYDPQHLLREQRPTDIIQLFKIIG
jgi:hypothetical protein